MTNAVQDVDAVEGEAVEHVAATIRYLVRMEDAKYPGTFKLAVEPEEGPFVGKVVTGLASVGDYPNCKGFRWLQAIFGTNLKLEDVSSLSLQSAKGWPIRVKIATRLKGGVAYCNIVDVLAVD